MIDRTEVREWLARRIVRARERGDEKEVDYLLDRYTLVDELATSAEILEGVSQ